jgi:hypothetical protein
LMPAASQSATASPPSSRTQTVPPPRKPKGQGAPSEVVAPELLLPSAAAASAGPQTQGPAPDLVAQYVVPSVRSYQFVGRRGRPSAAP